MPRPDASVSASPLPPRHLREEQGFSAVASSLLHVRAARRSHLVNLGSGRNGGHDAPGSPRLSGRTRTGRRRRRRRKGPASARQSNREAPTNRSPVASLPNLSHCLHRALIAPVALVAGDEKPLAPEADGTGPGSDPGVDDGTGGGAGGGPFRPGSGIEPPRLLREVKAQYTDDARKRGVHRRRRAGDRDQVRRQRG